MRMFKSICFFSILLLFSAGLAAVHCSEQRRDIDSYLRAHQGWSIVEVSDLPDDDKTLWNANYTGFCPGIAVVDVDGSGRKLYALALSRRVEGVLFEQLVVFTGNVGSSSAQVLVKPTKVISPFVVRRVGPGKYFDSNTKKTINIRHDSIVYEKMESISTQFYFLNGKVYSLLASE